MEGEVEEESFWTRNRLIAAALILLALIGLVLFLVLHKSSSKQVLVPDVLKQTAKQATATLQDRGFEVVPSPRPSAKPVNVVYKQDPRAGTTAGAGSTVTITFSTGLGKASVPDVSGKSSAEATKLLKARGFNNTTTKQRFSSSVAAGTVLDTDPPSGSFTSKSALITVVVSKGANVVSVPSVTGEQQSQAQSEITAAGLQVKVTQEDSDLPEGQVTDQTPGAGQPVKPGTTVTITVSNGLVLVPNVVGETEDQAKSDLGASGLKSVRVVNQSTSDEGQDGLVIKQVPAAGRRSTTSDTVTLYVAKFTAPTTTTTTTTTPTTTTTTTTPGTGPGGP